MFIFLSETNTSVTLASSKFSLLNLNFFVGVDAVGSQGGLVVLRFTNNHVNIMHSCQNFILCNVCEPSGTQWNVCFFYRAHVVNDKAEVWELLLQYLQPLPNCMITGDFNQVERYEDKLGGSKSIRSWKEFMSWRFNSNLIEVPFQGPRFTWTNKQLGPSLLLEGLDRAYVSSSWLTLFPNHILQHEHII